jgi:hypothetical protein
MWGIDRWGYWLLGCIAARISERPRSHIVAVDDQFAVRRYDVDAVRLKWRAILT